MARFNEDYSSIYSDSKLDRLIEDAGTSNITVKNPGVSELPDGAWDDWSVEKLVNHFHALAGKEGKQEVARIVNNIERWNENKNPSLSNKARSVMEKLHSKWESEK